MKSPAQIILCLSKPSEPFWLAFGTEVVGGKTSSFGDVVLVYFLAKHYDLQDHQFLRVVVDLKTEKNITFLIPREKITAVIEGEVSVNIGFGLDGSEKK